MIPIIKQNPLNDVKKRRDRKRLYQGDPGISERVRAIVDDVAKKGLPALLSYIQSLDSPEVNVHTLWVSQAEIDSAHAGLSRDETGSLRLAIKFISDYHAQQVPQGWQRNVLASTVVGLRYQPLDRVGVYVPGGRAAYPSTVLMNVIPARLAGVPEIIMATPAAKDGSVHPLILAAAKEMGISRILKAGGAHGIAALAFGFESFEAVDKIVGPGNVWVTEAKRQVYGVVSIDKLAGPTDLTVIADPGAPPARVAADLLAQAEHDPDSEVFLIATSENLVMQVFKALDIQLADLPRSEIVRQAFAHSAVYIAGSLIDAYKLANELAPEHLALMVEKPKDAMFYIHHAGAIFLGYHSPVALGDYMIGPNHVLPTAGTARYAGPLTVADFIKASSVVHCTRDDVPALATDIERLARLAGLEGHARSVQNA
jgi:histidinol dehydrogenase